MFVFYSQNTTSSCGCNSSYLLSKIITQLVQQKKKLKGTKENQNKHRTSTFIFYKRLKKHNLNWKREETNCMNLWVSQTLTSLWSSEICFTNSVSLVSGIWWKTLLLISSLPFCLYLFCDTHTHTHGKMVKWMFMVVWNKQIKLEARSCREQSDVDSPVAALLLRRLADQSQNQRCERD